MTWLLSPPVTNRLHAKMISNGLKETLNPKQKQKTQIKIQTFISICCLCPYMYYHNINL